MSILHQYLRRDKANKQEIVKVSLIENNLTGVSSSLIAGIISHLQVHTLLIHKNRPRIIDMKDISTSPTLKVLNLNDNKLRDLGTELLSKRITNTKTLRVVITHR